MLYLQYNTYSTYLQCEILRLLTVQYSTLYLYIYKKKQLLASLAIRITYVTKSRKKCIYISTINVMTIIVTINHYRLMFELLTL